MHLLMPEWLVALTLTFVLIDIFLSTEILSWGGIVTFAVYLTWKIGPSWKWGVLVFILALLVSAILHYFVFSFLIVKPIRAILQRGSPDEVIEKLQGARGKIHFVDGRPMFQWNGDELWPVNAEGRTYREGDRVAVVKIVDGTVFLASI